MEKTVKVVNKKTGVVGFYPESAANRLLESKDFDKPTADKMVKKPAKKKTAKKKSKS